MTTGWNGRIYNAVVDDGQPFVIVWDGQGMDYDFWVIPAGHPESDLAHEFLQFASTPKRQGDQTTSSPMGHCVRVRISLSILTFCRICRLPRRTLRTGSRGCSVVGRPSRGADGSVPRLAGEVS